MKFAVLKYNFSTNLGDEIQSLAAEQFLPRVDRKFDRENLHNIAENERHVLIMNGWFCHHPADCFPLSDSIVPVFTGFHIYREKTQYFLTPQCIEYFKKHEPIGCRDLKTMELLAGKGVNAFYSKCLTLTFPKRNVEPNNGKVFLVDIDTIPIPESLYRGAIHITHGIEDLYGDDLKKAMAKKLLELYRDEARLVITTRLHCALPCIAMGVPVIFFGNSSDSRISLLKDLNIKINRMPNKYLRILYKLVNEVPGNRAWGSRFRKVFAQIITRRVDWNPSPVDIEQEKRRLIDTTRDLIAQKISLSESIKN
jgi:hypothetical protein